MNRLDKALRLADEKVTTGKAVMLLSDEYSIQEVYSRAEELGVNIGSTGFTDMEYTDLRKMDIIADVLIVQLRDESVDEDFLEELQRKHGIEIHWIKCDSEEDKSELKESHEKFRAYIESMELQKKECEKSIEELEESIQHYKEIEREDYWDFIAPHEEIIGNLVIESEYKTWSDAKEVYSDFQGEDVFHIEGGTFSVQDAEDLIEYLNHKIDYLKSGE